MNRVRLIRLLRTISLRELAKVCKCSVGTIHAIEEDFNRPNVVLARRICAYLNADIGLLFPDDEVHYDDRITFYLQCAADAVHDDQSFDFEIPKLSFDKEFPNYPNVVALDRLFIDQKMSRSYKKFLSAQSKSAAKKAKRKK